MGDRVTLFRFTIGRGIDKRGFRIGRKIGSCCGYWKINIESRDELTHGEFFQKTTPDTA
jgi:hypothetical protein